MISEEVIRCLQGESMSHYDREHGYIEMTTPITDTAANTEGTSVIVGIMVTSISNDSIVATMEVLNRKADHTGISDRWSASLHLRLLLSQCADEAVQSGHGRNQ